MTKEMKNLYEDLIQGMIIDGIKGMTPEIKAIINNAPVDKRRVMILNILEENNPEHRLLCSKIQKTVNADNASESKHIKDVVKMLREYVKVSDTEIKTMGEVMTPIELVEEMLDTLPYEVWTNPNLKWLDPCNGVGTFVSVVVQRLMKGLESFQPDDKLRYQHIMENMIYVCELQAKNIFLYLYAFDPKDEYALNIYNGSYLDEGFDKHMKNILCAEKFDVIVMNPPYQVLQEGNTKSHPLWDKFVIKTVNNLVEGGYLVAVHPDGWRNVDGMFKDVQNLLKSKQILYLEIHDYSDGLKTFRAKTTYDFYCLHNVPNTMFTKIKGSDGKIVRTDISKMEFIPNGMFDIFEKLIAKNGKETVQIINNSSYHHQRPHMAKVQTEEFKYPCVYTSLSTDVVNFWYSNTNTKGHFEIPKVIFTTGTASKPIIDENGNYGLTEFASAIVDEQKNLLFIQKAMLSPEFIKLMNFRDGNGGKFGHRYDRKVIATFRKDFWVDFL